MVGFDDLTALISPALSISMRKDTSVLLIVNRTQKVRTS